MLYIDFPSWLHPEIIPGFPVRWYGLMYLFAFVIAYILFRVQIREKKLDWNKDEVSSLFTWGILGLLLGARLFATLVYDRTGRYLENPLLIFWPFDESFSFVGFQGMSYHGGLIGVVIGIILFCKRKNKSILQTTDLLVAAIPFGYFFGRMGNFINGELYGRVTAGSFGMIFPFAERFPVKESWVAEIMEKTGANVVAGGLVNLPRHPSQLYEAAFEGIVLGLVLWFVFRRLRLRTGVMTGLYLLGYGLIRFVIEYFREPDAELGFILSLSGENNPIWLCSSFLDFSMGQALCMLMMLSGTILIGIILKRK